jgi:hypothetical protein
VVAAHIKIVPSWEVLNFMATRGERAGADAAGVPAESAETLASGGGPKLHRIVA